jgi:hypothetical protein
MVEALLEKQEEDEQAMNFGGLLPGLGKKEKGGEKKSVGFGGEEGGNDSDEEEEVENVDDDLEGL